MRDFVRKDLRFVKHDILYFNMMGLTFLASILLLQTLVPFFVGWYLCRISFVFFNKYKISAFLNNRESQSTLFWVSLCANAYLIIGVFSEWEFIPNPFRFLFETSSNPFFFPADAVAFGLIGFFLCFLITMYKYVDRVYLMSQLKKFKPIFIGVVILAFCVGGIILQRESIEAQDSKILYEERTKVGKSVRAILASQESPFSELLFDVSLSEKGGIRLELKNEAKQYLDTPEERVQYQTPVEEQILKENPSIKKVEWVFW